MHAVGPRLSATPGALRRQAPRLAEHTVEVLRDIGLDAAAIAALVADGVVCDEEQACGKDDPDE
jgi:crotonobetainyl-CoA:carnitine CoA-transferase CaiB-like acyl-CoA transferase